MKPPPEALNGWRRARDRQRQLLAWARGNPAAFNALVLRDERNGGPIKLAPMHEGWHELISRHDRVIVLSHVEAGKSQQISIGRTLYELGRDHNLRVAIVSNTHTQAEKIVRTIARYVERSAELRAVTGLVPGEPWQQSALHVRRGVLSKDPSVQACGVHGNILGSRIDLLILDDVLDYENCRTAKARQDVADWYLSSLAGRLTDRSRVVVVGTAFHPDDLLHRLARQPGWAAVRYPVIDDETGLPRWPERWPLERIAKTRADMGPLEFARQMLCRARDDSESRFRMEWIERCKANGAGRRMAAGLEVVPAGYRTVTGVDLAVQQHSGADLTCLFTIIVAPSHMGETREVLSIESGRWSGPEIVARIIDAHRRYKSLVVVENNGAQEFLLQFARAQSAVPIRAYTTGRSKAHPEFGIEKIATEMAAGKWIIPNDDGRCHPEVDAWISEMLYYDPRAHTGDRVMASFFCVEGIRMSAMRIESGRLDLAAGM